VALTFEFHLNSSAIHSITGQASKQANLIIECDKPPLYSNQRQATEKCSLPSFRTVLHRTKVQNFAGVMAVRQHGIHE
jgi:hypothetical protein